MNRTCIGILMGALVLGPTVAHAQTAPPSGRTDVTQPPQNQQKAGATEQAPRATQASKYLLATELYLRNASNNAKAIYQAAQAPEGKMDAELFRDDARNIASSLRMAEQQVMHTQALPASEVPTTVNARFDALKSRLRRARDDEKALEAALTKQDRQTIQKTAGAVYGSVQAALDTYGDIASAMNVQRLDSITVPEKQPVGGGSAETPAGTDDSSSTAPPSSPEQGGRQQRPQRSQLR
jgi:hypothetical protein